MNFKIPCLRQTVGQNSPDQQPSTSTNQNEPTNKMSIQLGKIMDLHQCTTEPAKAPNESESPLMAVQSTTTITNQNKMDPQCSTIVHQTSFTNNRSSNVTLQSNSRKNYKKLWTRTKRKDSTFRQEEKKTDAANKAIKRKNQEATENDNFEKEKLANYKKQKRQDPSLRKRETEKKRKAKKSNSEK